MDLSLPIRILRDVYHRCGRFEFDGVYAEKKEDGSWITDVDPLVEHIVVEHLRAAIGGDERGVTFVREEAPAFEVQAVDQIRAAKWLVTIDGIDGTGRFVRQYNKGKPNAAWLAAMTAVYEKNSETGNYVPRLAFAYQPTIDVLFVFAEGQPLLVKHPLGKLKVHPLSTSHLDTRKPLAILDSYVTKDHCPHEFHGEYADKGPGGYAHACLLHACLPEPLSELLPKGNFTSFHYKLWDFGLWPILAATGLKTVDFEDATQAITELDIRWFGSGDEVPERIQRPLVIAPPELLDSVAKSIVKRAI